MDSYECQGTQELTQSFSIESTILQLQGKTAKLVRTVEEVSNTLKDVESNTESRFNQMAGEISLEVSFALDLQLRLGCPRLIYYDTKRPLRAVIRHY
jgi:hypothetical protein